MKPRGWRRCLVGFLVIWGGLSGLAEAEEPRALRYEIQQIEGWT